VKLCPHCGTPNDTETRFCAHCGGSLEDARPDPLIGRTVGGAYLLQELIGVGGMGRVYRAEQNMLGRTVAVKVIHPHLLGDDQTVARFYNEARAASRLNHPNSVSIIDFGRTEDGILYLVMEHLAGKDLAHILAEEGPLPFGRICALLRNVVSALGEAHALGVVHRDLKPENVIVRRVRRGAEQVKVVDFGLAHIVGPGGTSITTPGLVCGTPDYMAPEQGRGENVDGRGDLYAAGVVLFEMLTDRLPFEADTPTKVVFKHIHDPIPDPRVVAPHRAIPDDLAEICIKALQKKPEARYQSADELYEALGRAEERLSAMRNAATITCAACGTANPTDQRFCGTCGGRLTDRFAVPPSFRTSPPGRVVSAPPTPHASRFVGRDADIDRLMELRESTRAGAIFARVVGEAGVGKTRLLSELAARLVQQGDVVVMAGPHPSAAPVPYWPIRQLVRGLLGVDDAKLGQIVQSDIMGEPIARAGIAELLEAKGLEGCQGASRAEAVTVALAAAIRVAQGRAPSRAVALVVDDLHRCDALSADVLQRLHERVRDAGLFVVAGSSPHRELLEHESVVRMLLPGLDARDAAQLFSGQVEAVSAAALRELDTSPAGRLFLPLYLEQLRALGFSGLEADESLPPRLADAVLLRLERLDLSARRLLQVIAVLGDSAPLAWVRALSRDGDIDALDALRRDGLVSVDGTTVVFCHPFVRELVESSIPAEHRKELHALALEVAAGDGAPLEVRAEHAWRAGEPMSALLLLERMGDGALRRGDGSAAVLAFRRGLELARRELLLTGDTALDRAIVTFSRKLGDAMDWAGDSAGADGVLREALELAGPVNRERGKMLLLLSRVASRRNRPRDATRLLGQALELSTRQADRLGEAEAHLALGKLRLVDGDTLTAANTLKKAMDIARAEKGAGALLVEAALARADALRAIGDAQGADDELLVALSAAKAHGASGLLARVIAAQAAAAEAARERDRASSFYREASRVAAEAGDAEGARRWHNLGRASEARRAG
jgi:serine/threonine-protein kinase